MSKSIRGLNPVVAGVLVVAAMLPVTANAQAACADRASLVHSLSNDYAERPNSMGLAANGTLFEIFTSEKGSWTILATRPDGVSCLVATGEGWGSVPRLAQGPAA